MKIWLNDLKPGDTYYDNDGYDVYQYRIIDYANDTLFRMARFNVLNIDTKVETQAFVNHNVYTTYEEAVNAFIPTVKWYIDKYKKELENAAEQYKKFVDIYNNLNKEIKNG